MSSLYQTFAADDERVQQQLAYVERELRPSWLRINWVANLDKLLLWLRTLGDIRICLFVWSPTHPTFADVPISIPVVPLEGRYGLDPNDYDLVVRIENHIPSFPDADDRDVPLPQSCIVWIEKNRAVRDAQACYEKELGEHLPRDLVHLILDDYLLGHLAHPFEPIQPPS